jgi:hypothetical protein
MAEMHRTLKLLRGSEDQAAERAPQPGLGGLDDVLERSRAAGLHVELAVEGDPRPLAQSVDFEGGFILTRAMHEPAHPPAQLAHVRHYLQLLFGLSTRRRGRGRHRAAIA